MCRASGLTFAVAEGHVGLVSSTFCAAMGCDTRLFGGNKVSCIFPNAELTRESLVLNKRGHVVLRHTQSISLFSMSAIVSCFGPVFVQHHLS